MEALAKLLQGTGLEAKMASDRETVMIRSVTPEAGDPITIDSVRVTGRVVDSVSRKGLAGVMITATGTNARSITQADGSFDLRIVQNVDKFLSVRLLGYRSKQFNISESSNGRKNVTLDIAQSVTALNEVVTTATGSQRRVEVPNDIVRIDADKIIQRAPVQSVSDLLEAAQIPGVLVTRGSGDPGAPTKIRIRGIKSISQSNDPVVIVDGNWIDASMGKPSRIDDIDPSTIETIEIVRGPSASTLYGQDAANGVIIITTKRGQPGTTRWLTSYQRDWGQTYGTIPKAYAGIGYDPVTNIRSYCPNYRIVRFECIQDSVAEYDPNHDLLGKEGTESSDRYMVNVNGGTSSATYAITGTATNTVGVRRVAPINNIRFRLMGFELSDKFIRPSKLSRRNITTAINLTPRSNVLVGITVAGSQVNIVDNRVTHQNPAKDILGLADKAYSLDTLSFLSTASSVAAVEEPSQSSSVTLGGNVRWQPWAAWTVNGNFGVDRDILNSSMFTRRVNCINSGCIDSTGAKTDIVRSGTVYTARINASTRLDLGKLSRFLDIIPTLGGDLRRNNSNEMRIEKEDIPPGERTLTGGRLVNSTSNPVANATGGWYISSSIGLFQRMYFDVGIRQDIGSAIKSKQAGNIRYPKIGGSWLLSDEPFWPQTALISTFRLRSALGYSAVQPNSIDINGRYNGGYEFIDGKYVRSVNLIAAGNSNLLPERAMELELGFDADLINDRISLIATYSHSENRNGLIGRPLPQSAGGLRNTRMENIARLRNRDLELSAEIRVLENRFARVTLFHGMTMRENVVTKLGDGITPFSNFSMAKIAEGYPVAGVWTRRVMGYRDKDENGVLSNKEVFFGDSNVYVGWTQPKYEASYGTSIFLSNQLSFDARFQYKSKYVQSYTKTSTYGYEVATAPLNMQAWDLISGLNNKRSISDLRFTTASISYNVPSSLLKSKHIRTLTISLKGSNLGLWTNYAGRDPSVNNYIMVSEVPIDDGALPPPPRKYVLDFNLGF